MSRMSVSWLMPLRQAHGVTLHDTQEPQAAYTAQRHEHYVTLHVSDELDAAHGAASCAQ